jgi:hypothetical protein
MEFDLFGLSVKDHATRHMHARYNSTCPLYTPSLPTLTTPTLRVVPYALAATTSSITWLSLLRPPPGIIALATPAPMSSPSCQVAQL